MMRILKTFLLVASLAAASIVQAAPAAPQAELPPAPEAELAPAPGEEIASEAEVPLAEAAEAAQASDFYSRPVEAVGQPDGRMWLQDQYTAVGERAANFHDYLLMPIITVISLFVLALLLWVIVRYNRRTNPSPSKTTHNTLLEVAWTLVPVLILVAIFIPSYGLLRAQYDLPEGETVTVKVTGNQWNWTYEYPDHGDILLVSNMLEEEGDQAEGQPFRTAADGPRLLAVDERLVIPAGVNVRFLVTASDVLHSFAVPAFWTKIDAVPGRLNEGWVRVDRPGVYYGQCSELCGARHAYMPIAVEVLPSDRFAAWVRSKGGSMPGDAPADAGEDPATPIPQDSETPVPTDTVPGEAEGEIVDQAAVDNI